jgi:hypothetical protein
MFQLKRRLENLKISQPTSSLPIPPAESSRLRNESAALPTDLLPDSSELFDIGERAGEGAGIEDEEVEVDIAERCDGKPETGNRKVRARFGRRWTHNEELCVASCGVILGRATFLGSEAPNGVRVGIMFHGLENDFIT